MLRGKKIKTIRFHGKASLSTVFYLESFTDSIPSENWQSGEENRKRGRDWLDQIYKANHKATENTLAAHQDFCKQILETKCTFCVNTR